MRTDRPIDSRGKQGREIEEQYERGLLEEFKPLGWLRRKTCYCESFAI
ncbi:hypothetical protein [Rhodopirellula halodulae]|nr:hypothetical protein [Rhodopirellula sp. JC740]